VANKIVELQIQLKNAKSVSDLEVVIKDINKELKTLDTSSQAFQQLAEESKKAGTQLKDIKEELTAISSEKKADSVAKIGGALAAGFSVATIAAHRFGAESDESIQAAIQTGIELSVVLQSVKAISEGLASGNRKAFGELVNSFKASGIAAKLFGNVTKAAIAGTGIGLLIVAVGLLVANWDEVKKAVLGFVDTMPHLKFIKDLVVDLIERVGSLGNLFRAVGAGIKALFTAGKSAAEEFNKELERGKAVQALENQLELITAQNKERQRAIQILEAVGKKEREIIELKIAAAIAELNTLQELRKKGEEFNEDQKTRVRDLETEIALLEIRGKKLARDEAFDAFKKRADAFTKADKEAFEQEQNRQQERKELYDDANAELLEQYKERKQQEVKIDIEIEQEKVDVVQISELAKFRIKLETAKKEENQTRKQYEKNREDLIEYYESLGELTNEQEDILTELRLEKFNEFVNQLTPYVEAGLQAYNAISQAILDGRQREIDNLTLQIEGIDSRFNESVENRKALEAQLADAQGVARDQILKGIEEERKKTNQLAQEKKKAENQRIQQTNKMNQAQWQNDMINAIVNGALGVTKALGSSPPPLNFIMAALVGVLSGVQVGVIANNKPKPVPLMARGGFTGRGSRRDQTGERQAGLYQLHENEWIAPRWMVESNRYGSMIAQLEAIRAGQPMASGGFTTQAVPTVQLDSTGSFSADAMKAAVENANIYVSVVEVRDQLSNVSVIEDRGTL
jgi:hypothetical protein